MLSFSRSKPRAGPRIFLANMTPGACALFTGVVADNTSRTVNFANECYYDFRQLRTRP